MFIEPEPIALDESLRAALADLRRAASPIEAMSLGLGAHLARAIDALGRTAANFHDLSRRLDGGELACPVQTLGAAAARIAGLATSQDGIGDAELAQMAELATAMPGCLARLSKVIAGVKALGVNARVEAAGVAAAGQDFSVFTHEIGRLANVAETGLRELGREVQQVAATLRAARTGRSAFGQTHGQSLAAVAARIAAGLESVTAHRRDAAVAMANAGERSARARARVDEAVRALQIGDITRQRVEHACQAFRLLAETQAADLDTEERALLVAMVCRLQAAQLLRTADDISHEMARLTDSLRALADESHALAAEGEHILRGACDSDSFLVDLENEMRNADELLVHYRQAKSGVGGQVDAVSAMVKEMVRHVVSLRSTEVDMRVMGLNATFKCGRMGTEGRALSVIAQELRSHAGQTVETAGALMAHLERAIEVADRLTRSAEVDTSVAGLSTLIASMTDAVGQLGAAARHTEDSLAGLENESASVRTIIGEAMTCLAGQGGIVAELRRIASVLRSRAGDVRLDDPRAESIRARILETMEARYTMASERQVHLLFAGDDDATAEPAVAADEPGLDDILFD